MDDHVFQDRHGYASMTYNLEQRLVPSTFSYEGALGRKREAVELIKLLPKQEKCHFCAFSGMRGPSFD